MKPLRCWLSIFYLLTAVASSAQKTIRLTSPDGRIIFSCKPAQQAAMYTVAFNGKTLINSSSLGLRFADSVFSGRLQWGKLLFRDTTEEYELVVGKVKAVRTHYKEVTLPLQEATTPHRKLNLIVRAFNDGIAFRYEMPTQQAWPNYTLLEEGTTFALAGNPAVRALLLPSYTSSHEGLYTHQSFNALREDTLMDMPALFEFPGAYLAITEAALLDYAGMYLMKQGDRLVSKLSPLPGQTAVKVKAVLPHRTPWRVLMISDRIGALMESTILTDLNSSPKIANWSWLKPGKTTFPWWNGNVLPDTINAPGNNFVTAQYYIDFCARNNIGYHSVVEYGLHQWYTDDGVGFQPGPNADVTKPVPGLDMKEICDYARTKGVGVRVWIHWAALYPKLDTAFALFEKWGLQGMMVDFMDRDDQQMVNIQTEMLEKAAKHRLHIQFHGAYKPTGLHRTYPNEFTREGTLNYEVDKWTPTGLSPDHDINMPFTRMLAGSTDYHLGGFRAATQTAFKMQYTRPLVLGTRCHMLAMYVVLENYLQMVCDYPAAYEGEDGFDFIKNVPTTWDAIRVLDAKVGEYVIVARRKGEDWYVGAITNTEAREIRISLSFLTDGTYRAEIYKDAPDAGTNPNHLTKQTQTVSKQDNLPVWLAPGGGAVIHLKKQ